MSGDRGILRGRLLLCGVATIVGLTGCVWQSDPKVTLATLEQSLPTMEAWATEWNEDAALWFVSFDILPKDESPNQQSHKTGAPFKIEPMRRTAVTGFYLSLSDFTEVLTISIRRDASMDWDTMSMDGPPPVFVPIEKEDWALDSTEALKIALSREGVRFLRENEVSQCSRLTLRREEYEPKQPTVWAIFLETCGLPDSEPFRRTFLDATTGEILSQDT